CDILRLSHRGLDRATLPRLRSVLPPSPPTVADRIGPPGCSSGRVHVVTAHSAASRGDYVISLRRAALGTKSEFSDREIDPIPQPLTTGLGGTCAVQDRP